jgi:acyl-coenzyme A synthetase/AMP-(fatty) acid ligase
VNKIAKNSDYTIDPQVQELGCKFIVCAEATFNVVNEAASGSSVSLVFYDEASDEFAVGRGGKDLEKVPDQPEKEPPEPVDLDVDEDLAIVTFTSGTTGCQNFTLILKNQKVNSDNVSKL